MQYIFEGKTVDDAIEKAIESLHIDRSNFDVRVISEGTRGVFKHENAKIEVSVVGSNEDEENVEYSDEDRKEQYDDENDEKEFVTDKTKEPENDGEKTALDFISEYGRISNLADFKAEIIYRTKNGKLGINIFTGEAPLVIGRGGKNLDSLQNIVNSIPSVIENKIHVVVDCENYRVEREEKLVENAKGIAKAVLRTGKSRLLEPLNPFERRLIHRAISKMNGVSTKSEEIDDSQFKRIRIFKVKKY